MKWKRKKENKKEIRTKVGKRKKKKWGKRKKKWRKRNKKLDPGPKVFEWGSYD